MEYGYQTENEINDALERFNIPSIKTLEEEKEAEEIADWLDSLIKDSKEKEVEEPENKVRIRL